MVLGDVSPSFTQLISTNKEVKLVLKSSPVLLQFPRLIYLTYFDCLFVFIPID